VHTDTFSVVFQLNTAIEKRTDELQHSLVFDSCRQPAHEPVVVYAVKELGEINAHHNLCALLYVPSRPFGGLRTKPLS